MSLRNLESQRSLSAGDPGGGARGWGAAVDVGCGDGLLARKLAGRCASVTGIDRDERIRAGPGARAGLPGSASSGTISWLSVWYGQLRLRVRQHGAASHGLRRGAGQDGRLLRPGGRLAVVGLARRRLPRRLGLRRGGIPANRYYKLTRGEVDPGAPIREPDMTWAQVRRTAGRALPAPGTGVTCCGGTRSVDQARVRVCAPRRLA